MVTVQRCDCHDAVRVLSLVWRHLLVRHLPTPCASALRSYVSSMLLLAMALAVCLPLVIDYQGSQTNKWLLLGFVCQEVFFAVWFDY